VGPPWEAGEELEKRGVVTRVWTTVECAVVAAPRFARSLQLLGAHVQPTNLGVWLSCHLEVMRVLAGVEAELVLAGFAIFVLDRADARMTEARNPGRNCLHPCHHLIRRQVRLHSQ